MGVKCKTFIWISVVIEFSFEKEHDILVYLEMKYHFNFCVKY